MIETPIFDELAFQLLYEPGDPFMQYVYELSPKWSDELNCAVFA